MSKGTNAYVAVEGNLALSLNKSRFRVIEGGRTEHSRRIVAADSSSQHISKCKANARTTRNVGIARKRHVACLVTTLLAVSVLAVTWRVTDIASQRRIDAALAQATFQTVTVMPGDSLWNIAERNPVEGCTTSELVRCIRDVNQIDDACLQTGMRLSVPHSL